MPGSAAPSSIEHVAASSLFVSQPEPRLFGNPPNEAGHPAWSNPNWLLSRFHFSFAEYRSCDREGFGVLRVMNDDLVQPRQGFGAHPHRDMEIVTYVVEGELTHQDSMGRKETLGPGAVQFMTAGSGVTHSEHNWGPTPLRFIQTWIVPRRRGLRPNYGSYSPAGADYAAGWTHLVSDVEAGADTPVKLNQDVNFFVSEGAAPRAISIKSGRQAYVLCVTGDALLEAASPAGARTLQPLRQHDAVYAFGEVRLVVQSHGAASILVVEMAMP